MPAEPLAQSVSGAAVMYEPSLFFFFLQDAYSMFFFLSLLHLKEMNHVDFIVHMYILKR